MSAHNGHTIAHMSTINYDELRRQSQNSRPFPPRQNVQQARRGNRSGKHTVPQSHHTIEVDGRTYTYTPQTTTPKKSKKQWANKEDLETIFNRVILNPPLTIPEDNPMYAWRRYVDVYLDTNQWISYFMQYDGPLKRVQSVMSVVFNNMTTPEDREAIVDIVKTGMTKLENMDKKAISATLKVLNKRKRIVDWKQDFRTKKPDSRSGGDQKEVDF